MEVAQKLALEAYDKFNQRRLAEEAKKPDAFDKEAQRLRASPPPARGKKK